MVKKQPNQKMGTRHKQALFQRRHTDGQQAHEKMLNISDTREIQIKVTMRYHLTLVRMTIIKCLQIINAGEGVEKRDPSCTVGGNAKWCSYYGEQHGGSSKKLNIELPYDPVIPPLGIYPDKTLI